MRKHISRALDIFWELGLSSHFAEHLDSWELHQLVKQIETATVSDANDDLDTFNTFKKTE